MVQATITESTPNLVPLAPDWMQRQGQQGPNTNRNINDIYWQKGPNEADPGWIIVGPSAQPGANGRPLTAQAERWIRKGRKPLIQYSLTNRVSPLTGQRETIETNADRLGTDARYYWFFANGGAHLFPIEQIVAHHWHITPPFGLTLDVFPQLKEYEVPSAYYCAACAGSQTPKNSEEELITHAMLTHRMTLPAARELLEFASEPPRGAKGLKIRRKARVAEATVTASEEETEEETAARLSERTADKLTCPQCGKLTLSPLGLQSHMRSHNKYQ